MILDSGKCSIYRRENTANAGCKPVYEDVLFHEGYYAELNFATSPARPTDARKDIRTDAKIRILQNRQIREHHRVILQPFDGQAYAEDTVFEVARAWHGQDEESGEEITELTLEVVEP